MRVVIIGAGLIGICTAYFLNRHGFEVVVLERESEPGLDTSFANGGMLTPSQSEPWNHPGFYWDLLAHLRDPYSPFILRPGGLKSILTWGLKFLCNSGKRRFYQNMLKNVRLTSYSMQVLRQLRHDLGMRYDERCMGTLKFYTDEKDFLLAEKHSSVYRDMGIKYELLGVNEILLKEPSLKNIRTALIGGIYYPDDESGDAHKFCQLLAMHASDAGVKFIYRTEIKGFTKSGDKITGITTQAGVQIADKYILAAGSYSSLLAKTVHISLPIQPVKGYSLTLNVPENISSPGLPVIDETRHMAMTPLGSRLRVVGTAELDGFDKSINPARIDHMINYLKDIYPEIISMTSRENIFSWSGLRPYSSDGVPFIGDAGYKNLYLNTGHGHLGWSMCAGSGKLLADYINNKSTEIDPRPFRYNR